ncbi:MAG TPA: DUF4238 domain-containing protein [Rhodothermales bacterium]
MPKLFKNNHEVPRLLLKNWDDGSERRPGVWVFDIEEQRVYRSHGTGQRAFSFAILPDLYVPEVSGTRFVEAEGWFGRSEASLAKFLRRLRSRRLKEGVPPEELVSIVFGIASLGLRGGYQVRAIEEALLDPAWQEMFGVPIPDRAEAHRRAVENCVNAIAKRVLDLMFPRIEILTDLEEDLLLCDRPTLDLEDDHEISMPLGPRTIALIRRGHPRDVTIALNRPRAGSADFVATCNSLTCQRARRWVVGSSRAQIEGFVDQLTAAAVAHRAAKDRLRFKPQETPPQLWWAFSREGQR